jgi:hypothetical protein
MSCRKGVLRGKRGSGTDLGCESPRLGWVDAIAVICGKCAAKACQSVSTAESGRNKSPGVGFLGYPEPGRMEKPVWFERTEPQRLLGVSHYLAVLGKKCLGWPTRHLQRSPSGGQIESNFDDTGGLHEGASLFEAHRLPPKGMGEHAYLREGAWPPMDRGERSVGNASLQTKVILSPKDAARWRTTLGNRVRTIKCNQIRIVVWHLQGQKLPTDEGLESSSDRRHAADD